MTQLLQSMAWPFAACLVLTGIHVYLGIHVLARKVIFVDLALAQIAALGSVWGVLLGWDVHEDALQIKGFSLAFAVVGAAVFSLTRMRRERVPHEAIIGITYAVALAAAILFSAHLAHGAEEVRDFLTGSILWVDAAQVGWTALLYAAVGGFHFAFRRRFFQLSLDHEGAAARGVNVRLWDFLFYVSFGFVVTSSVSIAGVLLVFTYLVIPAVVGVLFAESIPARLAIGWTVGTLVSAFGVALSYYRDLPSGPTIVVSFGAFLAAAGLVHYVWRSPARGQALARSLAGVVAVAAFVLGSLQLRKREHHDLVHLLETGTPAERLQALAQVEADPALWTEVRALVPELLAEGEAGVRRRLLELVAARGDAGFLDAIHPLLRDPDDVLREEAVLTLRWLERADSVEPLLAAAEVELDDHLRVEMAEAILELGDPRGVPILIEAMELSEARQTRRDAYEHLAAHVPLDIVFDAYAAPEVRAAQLRELRAWWEEHGDEVRPLHLHQPLEPPGTASRPPR